MKIAQPIIIGIMSQSSVLLIFRGAHKCINFKATISNTYSTTKKISLDFTPVSLSTRERGYEPGCSYNFSGTTAVTKVPLSLTATLGNSTPERMGTLFDVTPSDIIQRALDPSGCTLNRTPALILSGPTDLTTISDGFSWQPVSKEKAMGAAKTAEARCVKRIVQTSLFQNCR
ncbi:hypothetical protein AAJV73_11365 [Cyanobium sp. BSA11S]|uniref:hypothetical protein n=1 Tax=Cyanobium sp. BSA11S TaxID=3108224 RepID=UPI003D8163D4